jgi:predicted AAA+ superfamily ATPase
LKVFLEGAEVTLPLRSLSMKIRIDIPNFHGRIHPMIDRPFYLKQLSTAVKRSPITALLGPRQVGKTTLAHMFGRNQKAVYFDLESQPDIQRLQNPELVLGSLEGVVVLDEIQRMPELFNVLRVLVDRQDDQARFLVLGSASPDIVKNVSETLAGRVEFIELDEDSMAWREGFITTFLERDIPQLGITIPPLAMRRFWTMLAHYHGQTWNASELARSMGLTDKTVRSYLDVLTGTFIVRQLQPWYENIGKRQVKAPKIYLRDSGILHGLLNLPDFHSLSGHPRVGASWEGFALEQILQNIRPPQAYFWATHTGAELDLFLSSRGRRYGAEFKFNEAPKITKSMRIAVDDLKLDHLWIIYPGQDSYPVDDKISVRSVSDIRNLTQEMT